MPPLLPPTRRTPTQGIPAKLARVSETSVSSPAHLLLSALGWLGLLHSGTSSSGPILAEEEAHADATTARTVTPIEQHVHRFVEIIPLMALVTHDTGSSS